MHAGKYFYKKVVMFSLFFLMVFQLIQFCYASNVNGSNFNVYFSNGSSLGFQNGNRYVLLEVTSGNLNSSENTLTLDSDGGLFRFEANETTTLYITFNVSSVKVFGDQNNEHRIIPSGTSISINATDTVTIYWDITYEFWLPMMFVFGMVGMLSTFGGALYIANEVKKKNYYDAFRNGVIIMSIGIALVLAWLW